MYLLFFGFFCFLFDYKFLCSTSTYVAAGRQGRRGTGAPGFDARAGAGLREVDPRRGGRVLSRARGVRERLDRRGAGGRLADERAVPRALPQPLAESRQRRESRAEAEAAAKEPREDPIQDAERHQAVGEEEEAHIEDEGEHGSL